jgi:hypothetical protein
MEDLGETDLHYKGYGYSFGLGLALIAGIWRTGWPFWLLVDTVASSPWPIQVPRNGTHRDSYAHDLATLVEALDFKSAIYARCTRQEPAPERLYPVLPHRMCETG